MTRNRGLKGLRGAFLAAAVLVASGCPESPDLTLPTPDVVEGYYSYEGTLKANLSGNVAEVVVTQPATQLRRGGSLWARVGPYIVLFTDDTQKLLDDYPGLAGVRVITRVAGGPEVARALLNRDELTGVLWRRSLNISGRARLEGTDKPTLLEDLVRWGEDHTQFEYNARYTSR
ncbi:MAG TPA: hypothetical protein VLA43_04040 [Longimicrobiales bacterium]|nr:hypothetical protein [Longimicrobiales bacterium]